MDFSRLHTYTPPQCLPENTGYTYALSSSYSSSALDFETENKIDPVFDSPRMSRRSLRLAALALTRAEDAQDDSLRDSSYARSTSFSQQSSRTVRQRKSTNKQSGSTRHSPRKNLSSSAVLNQSSFNSHASDTSMVSTVLDESLIRERTEVDHFWGLDEEGDPKGGDAALMQGNGNIATAETQTTMINGYPYSGCSMLSERKEVLTAYSASPGPSSRIYSRDRSQKHASRGTYFYMSKILRVVKHAAASFASLLVQLFQMVLLKLGYEFKAHSVYYGSTNVREFRKTDSRLGVIEETICDDCKGKKHLEMYTTEHTQSSWAKRVARTVWHTFSYAGRAASGMLRLLRAGWYQLVTLMSLLKVFLLKRCLPKCHKLLLFIPLLLLLGIWFWGFDGFIALLPSLNWTRMDGVQRTDGFVRIPEPLADSFHSVQPPQDTINIFDPGRIRELEKQMSFLSDKYHLHDKEYTKVMVLLQNLQDQVSQMSDKSETLELIKNVMGQHLQDMKSEDKTDFLALHKEHELRILMLEDLLGKLSTESKDIQKELDIAKAKTMRDYDEHSQLLSRVQKLELEFSQMRSELLTGESVRTSCEKKIDVIHQKVDAQVKESVRLMLFGDQHQDFPESLLQWLTSNFVSKTDLQASLRDLELRILKDITLRVSVTNQKPTSEIVTTAMTNAGISGVTEEQVHVIVNNALKLYSQDKTGMVDYALESAGGSIVSTRCSETFETQTALMSLFGIPLWYFSQSPRVVIQPDMYPGNCWAFKGSQGYLVVRLAIKIYPTAFTLEHIPKAVALTGNITSALKDFAVYGLDDEYQEEGKLLGRYVYEEAGEPLQTFPVMENTGNAFQVVELRIFSNWGHVEYTCLYRFRVHGKPAE
ncbi:Sad1 and UNC84 domain containing 1, transcript variant X3 [Columba livia]|uniref:Sad1 and UNC84 domain containing 1, transcript variant X3 n=1 Tax=Columba livia TaxID=8932 RepID=A0A2I0M0Q4_COLLI|nr:SUN domain-containing protein 1 isoform X2 [Columba livia]PKK23267.1 Sad1 and UNC84 domain containing 1, transcript variant X3 [Columba livia]